MCRPRVCSDTEAIWESGGGGGGGTAGAATWTLLARCIDAAAENYRALFNATETTSPAPVVVPQGSPVAAAPDSPAELVAKRRRTASNGGGASAGVRQLGLPARVTIGVLDSALVRAHDRADTLEKRLQSTNTQLAQEKTKSTGLRQQLVQWRTGARHLFDGRRNSPLTP